jgi:prolyl-tRNA synthetase
MVGVHPPALKTYPDLAWFLGIVERLTAKALFFRGEGKPVFVAIRGDLDVNEVKLKNALKARDVEPMDEAMVRSAGLVAGSASPVGLSGMTIVADESLTMATNLVAGANEDDWHLRNTNYGRDWRADVVANVALAREGDACARCGTALEVRRGIEMGHVFKLGTMYADALDVQYLDEGGERQPVVMGCYGIGLERLIAACIEANHDENGITWPEEVAPYDVHVVALNLDQEAVQMALAGLEEGLKGAGLSVLVDDRDESAGIKFKDADLLGIPWRVTVSPRALERGGVELRNRRTGETEVFTAEDVLGRIRRD